MQSREYRLVLLGNWAQALAGILLCWLGVGVGFFLLAMQLHLNRLNRNPAESTGSLILLCASNAAAAALAHMLAYNLYYLLISPDALTLTVGQMGMAADVCIVLVMSVFTVAAQRRALEQ